MNIKGKKLLTSMFISGGLMGFCLSGCNSATDSKNVSENKVVKTQTKKDNNKFVSAMLKSIFATAKKETKSPELLQELTESEKACDDIYDMFSYCRGRIDFANTIRFLLEPLKQVDYSYYNVAYDIASAAYKTYAAEMYSKTYDREYDQAASYMSVAEAQTKLNTAVMKAMPFIVYRKVANVFVFNTNQQSL
ncbi:MAG: hypothetical protein IJV03_03380 [Alphaproteobacteria bacterium]|nr:hypothetical protein [Alphaproteobacteria bacterium]